MNTRDMFCCDYEITYAAYHVKHHVSFIIGCVCDLHLFNVNSSFIITVEKDFLPSHPNPHSIAATTSTIEYRFLIIKKNWTHSIVNIILNDILVLL